MSLYTFFLILAVLNSAHPSSLPIIGIVANPDPQNDGDFTASSISASYVRWLENAGAMTMVIQPWYTESQLDEIINSVNGIIFLGGDRNLDLNKQYEKNAVYLVKKSIEAFNAGNPIPIWGTCQGFQLIQSIFMEKVDLKHFDSWNFPSPIKLLNKNSPILEYFTPVDFANAESRNIFPEFHHLGIEPSQYNEYPILGSTFEIVATAFDRNGLEYVSIVIGKKYPIFAVQFHPEKVSTNRNKLYDIVIDTESVRVAENFANFFVDRVRENRNTFTEDAKGRYHFIDSFVDPLLYDGTGLYYYEYRNDEKHFLK
jgi:gamma-glutamyl hydrolase